MKKNQTQPKKAWPSPVKSMAVKIREWMPNAFKRKIGYVGNFFSYPNYPNVKATLEYLKNWGFNPEVMIDVGAYSGEWTTLFKGIYPSTKVLMIEAQDIMVARLQEVCKQYKGDVRYASALLGAADGEEVTFAEAGFGSSVYEENSSYARSHIKKPLARLDSLLERYPDSQNVNFLKLDVQGYELEVLKGAPKVINSAEFILLETSLIAINQGCPLFSDVVKFMEKMNFRLLDFCGQYRRKDGALWQTDLIFVRNNSKFVPVANINPKNW